MSLEGQRPFAAGHASSLMSALLTIDSTSGNDRLKGSKELPFDLGWNLNLTLSTYTHKGQHESQRRPFGRSVQHEGFEIAGAVNLSTPPSEHHSMRDCGSLTLCQMIELLSYSKHGTFEKPEV